MTLNQSHEYEIGAEVGPPCFAKKNKLKMKQKFGLRTRNENTDDPTTEEVLQATVSSTELLGKTKYKAMSSIFDNDGGSIQTYWMTMKDQALKLEFIRMCK